MEEFEYKNILYRFYEEKNLLEIINPLSATIFTFSVKLGNEDIILPTLIKICENIFIFGVESKSHKYRFCKIPLTMTSNSNVKIAEEKTLMKSPRIRPFFVSVENSYIYAIGGDSLNWFYNIGILVDCEKYDILQDKWTIIPKNLKEMSILLAFNICQYIYCISSDILAPS